MCADHFSDLLKEIPLPDSNDPLVLFRWSVNIHNRVNSRIGKPTLDPEQAMKKWSTKFDFKIVLIILLALALGFMSLRGNKPI